MTTQSEAGVPTRSTWQLDPAHTLVEFSGKHMMFTTVKGHFKSVRGTIVLDEADPSRSSVEVEIDTPSLYSGVEYRDTHLKSPDFLDIERHPTITFKSTSVELLGTELAGRGKDPMGREVISFDARTSINRKDFGLTWNLALETGGFLVGDIIKIELAVEAMKQSV